MAESNQNPEIKIPGSVSVGASSSTQFYDSEYSKNQRVAGATADMARIKSEGEASNITYWLENVYDIESSVNRCRDALVDVIKKLQSMHQILIRYVNNSNGKGWGDENSIKFAKWWNNGASGRIHYNKKIGFEIHDQDTQDGLKKIMNKCARLYWLVICNQIYVVTEGKFMTKSKSFSPYLSQMYHYGQDKTYIEKKIDDDATWMDLLAKVTLTDNLKWEENFLIPDDNNGGKSLKEMAMFVGLFITAIKDFETSLNTYIGLVNIILQDNGKKSLFGITPNANMSKASQNLINTSTAAIASMVKYTKAVVEEYQWTVNDVISKYINKEYNINGGM